MKKSLFSAGAIALLMAVAVVLSESMHYTLRSPYFIHDFGAGIASVLVFTTLVVLVMAVPIGLALRDSRLQACAICALVYLAVSVKVFVLDADLFGDGRVVGAFCAFTVGVFVLVPFVMRRLKLGWLFPVYVTIAYVNVCLAIAAGWSLGGGRLFPFLTSPRTIAIVALTAVLLAAAVAVQAWLDRRPSAWQRFLVIVAVLFALVTATLVATRALPETDDGHRPSNAPDIYVVSFDALRQDMLMQFIEQNPDSNFARLASHAERFANVVATGPSTDESLARNTFLGDARTNCATSLPYSLAQRGYYTAMLFGAAGRRFEGSVCYEYYFAGGGAALKRRYIVPAIATRLFSKPTLRAKALPAAELLEKFQQLIRNPLPLYAYLHFLELHAPYVPASKRGDSRFIDSLKEYMKRCYVVACARDNSADAALVDAMRAAYLELLKESDDNLGRTLQMIRQRGRDHIIIITADHGELFGEHGGYGHGGGFVPELLNVPFIVYDSRRESHGLRCELALASEALAAITGLRPVGDNAELSFSAPPLGRARVSKSGQTIRYELNEDVMAHVGTWRNVHRTPTGILSFPLSKCQ